MLIVSVMVQVYSFSLIHRSSFVFDPTAMFARARNTATPEDMAKAIRSEIACLDQVKYMKPDLDDVVEEYHSLILEMLRRTPRPTSALIRSAAAIAFPKAPMHECRAFGEQISNAVSHCRQKLKSMTSGKKLSEGVRRVTSFLQCSLQSSPERETTPPSTKRQKLEDNATDFLRPPSRQEVLALYGHLHSSSSSSSSSSSAIAGEANVIDSSQEMETPKKYVVYMDSQVGALVRVHEGQKEYASMRQGPRGFAMARFGADESEVETEMPNIMLEEPVLKKPSVKRKPASRLPPLRVAAVLPAEIEEEDVEEEQAVEDEEVDPPVEISVKKKPAAKRPPRVQPPVQEADHDQEDGGHPAMEYHSMHYKSKLCWAIRQKNFAKRQILQLQYYEAKNEKKCLKIVQEGLAKLEDGVSEEDVKMWCREAFDRFLEGK